MNVDIEYSQAARAILNLEQRDILMRLANGQDDFEICQALHMTRAELTTIEKDIHARLNANTNAHAITRAFLSGVFIQRMICAALLAVTTFTALNDNMTRAPRNVRAPILQVRAKANRKEYEA